MCYRRLIKALLPKKWPRLNRKGVALLIVLSAMATLAIFTGEIVYTAQINQKLAYDRLNQIKAHALVKSGLRIALLRIRAYSELKKTISTMTGKSDIAKKAADAMVPKAILEKIWAEPVTIPFTGDISALPLGTRDALTKFRKDSSMEGKVYIAIEAQSSKFNLNSMLPSVATATTASPSPSPGKGASPSPSPDSSSSTSSTNQYTPDSARALLLEHIKQIFAKKFDDDPDFRDQYRSYKVEDLVSEMIGWADIGFDTTRTEQAVVPFKRAPYYDISELHYLTSMDDDVYNLLAPQFNAGMSQGINVNTIKDAVLRGLVPQMTDDERKAFFEFRDAPPPDDNSFKSGDDFFKYLGDKVDFFKNGKSKLDDFKTALTQRGIQLITDERYFKIRVEATVNQTKRTLEAWVTVLDSPSSPTTTGTTTPGGNANPSPSPTNGANGGSTGTSTNGSTNSERSTLKITQIRFL